MQKHKRRRFLESEQQGEPDALISMSALKPVVEADKGLTGRKWEIVIIGADSPDKIVQIGQESFVLSRNMRLYSVAALEQSAALWEGVRVYDNHQSDAQYVQSQGMRSVKDEWIGVINAPRWEASTSQLLGVLTIVDEALASKLKIAWEEGALKGPNAIGLSINTFPQLAESTLSWEGQDMPVVVGFDKIVSVDVVADPAAGGKFRRLLASTNAQAQETEDNMNPQEKLLQALRAILEAGLPDGLRAIVEAAIAEIEGQIAEANSTNDDTTGETGAPAAAAQTDAAPESGDDETEDADTATEGLGALLRSFAATLGNDNGAAQQALSRVQALETQLAQANASAALERALGQPGISAPVAQLARQQFGGRVFESAQLDEFLNGARAIETSVDSSGFVRNAGAQRRSTVEHVFDQRDKFEIAFMQKVMWGSEWDALRANDLPPVVAERIPEAFKAWERAGRPNMTGTPFRVSEMIYQVVGGNPLDPRFSEALTSSGLTSIVKNTVNLRLAADYSKRENWWSPIVRQETVNTIDDATLARTFGLASLPVVSEGAAYTELGWSDEEETASYVKRGAYLGITLEALLKDKLNALRTLPGKLADTWYNSLSDLVAAVFTTNSAAGPVLSDTGALFNATAVGTGGGHANLLTTAFGYDAWAAIVNAMAKQTDRPLGAGRRLLIRPRYILTPVDLENTVDAFFGNPDKPGTSDNDVNPYAGKATRITVPSWTDTNNFAAVADPNQWPAIWVFTLAGMRTPAVVEAGSDASGAMFSNDTLRYKIRLITFRYSSTYDCAPIGDWRPLHKSNVS